MCRTTHVFVKALADLFPHNTTGESLGRDDAGAVARLFKVLVVNRFHDRMRNIKRGQVHQFKGAEFETDLVFQYAVNGGEISHTFANDSQRLGAVATTGMVDDEARTVIGLHRRVPHLPGISSQVGADAGAGLEAGNDLYHLHQRHRVEEVIAGKLLRSLQLGGNRSDRQGRGVGDQYRARFNDALKLGEQLGLDVQTFNDRFDDQFAGGEFSERADALKTRLVLGGLLRVEATLLAQFVPLGKNRSLGRLCSTRLHVEQLDAAAGLHSNLCNAATHGTGTDDAEIGKYWFHTLNYDSPPGRSAPA